MSLVDYYRRTRHEQLVAIIQAGQTSALTTGLALKENRVAKLQQLAQLLEEDLFGELLWTDDVKSVGFPAMRVDIERFNAAEVREHRGIIEDIAKEQGERKQINEHTGAGGLPLFPLDEVIDRGLRKVYGKKNGNENGNHGNGATH